MNKNKNEHKSNTKNDYLKISDLNNPQDDIDKIREKVQSIKGLQSFKFVNLNNIKGLTLITPNLEKDLRNLIEDISPNYTNLSYIYKSKRVNCYDFERFKYYQNDLDERDYNLFSYDSNRLIIYDMNCQEVDIDEENEKKVINKLKEYLKKDGLIIYLFRDEKKMFNFKDSVDTIYFNKSSLINMKQNLLYYYNLKSAYYKGIEQDIFISACKNIMDMDNQKGLLVNRIHWNNMFYINDICKVEWNWIRVKLFPEIEYIHEEYQAFQETRKFRLFASKKLFNTYEYDRKLYLEKFEKETGFKFQTSEYDNILLVSKDQRYKWCVDNHNQVYLENDNMITYVAKSIPEFISRIIYEIYPFINSFNEENWGWLKIDISTHIPQIERVEYQKFEEIYPEFENIKKLSDLRELTTDDKAYKLLEKFEGKLITNSSKLGDPNFIMTLRTLGDNLSWSQDIDGKIFANRTDGIFYVANNLPEFLSHLIYDNDFSKEKDKAKVKKWICEWCENELSTKFRLQEHTKKCTIKDYLSQNENLKLFSLLKDYQEDILLNYIVQKSNAENISQLPFLLKIIKDNLSNTFQDKVIDMIYTQDKSKLLLELKNLEFNVIGYLEKYRSEIESSLVKYREKLLDKSLEDIQKHYYFEKISIYQDLGFEIKNEREILKEPKIIYLSERDFGSDEKNCFIKRKGMEREKIVTFLYQESEDERKFEIIHKQLKKFKELSKYYFKVDYEFTICNLSYNEELVKKFRQKGLNLFDEFDKSFLIAIFVKDKKEDLYFLTLVKSEEVDLQTLSDNK